jgi:hypothetical protein
MVSTNLVGNVGHVVSMISVIVFLLAVAKHLLNPSAPSVFDPAWTEYGFCIKDPASLFWSSHFVCLYVDVAATLGMLAMYYFYIYSRPSPTSPIIQYINPMFVKSIPGVLLHGLAHGGLGVLLHKGLGSFSSLTSHPASVNPVQLLILLVFWFFLLRTALPNCSVAVVAIATAVAFGVHVLFIPLKFAFTYVQTVLLVAFSCDQLLLPTTTKQNNIAYSLFPWLAVLPLSFVAWMESIECSAFVREYFYGHVIYDAFIPASVMAWFQVSYYRYAPVEAQQHQD